MSIESFSELPEVYIQENEGLLTLELKTKDYWLKGEFTFEPVKESRFTQLPLIYVPQGQISSAFFRRSPRQHEEALVLSTIKGFRSYVVDVFPHFFNVSKTFKKHGYPIEELDRVTS